MKFNIQNFFFSFKNTKLSNILGISEVDNTTQDLIVTPETTTTPTFNTLNTSKLQNTFFCVYIVNCYNRQLFLTILTFYCFFFNVQSFLEVYVLIFKMIF